MLDIQQANTWTEVWMRKDGRNSSSISMTEVGGSDATETSDPCDGTQYS